MALHASSTCAPEGTYACHPDASYHAVGLQMLPELTQQYLRGCTTVPRIRRTRAIEILPPAVAHHSRKHQRFVRV